MRFRFGGHDGVVARPGQQPAGQKPGQVVW
jgi:hypothetical protein